ncbi:MAG: hypothetical protein JWN86_432 [Planctomycetota bacterium]|nr:hypothetical protein [Planctomycetota bacterium]
MRRSRRGLSGGHEFGGSGEDSFVAVVVTKLTGALLFILLLTMVIMALIPKADEEQDKRSNGKKATLPELRIATPASLPEAIAGRPYTIALAAEGGVGKLRWAVDGPMPKGLAFDRDAGLIQGTPKTGTPNPVELVVRVQDDTRQSESTTRLVVYQSDSTLTVPSRWRPGLPPVPWRAWMEQGFGFLVLLMTHLVGMNVVSAVERASLATETSMSKRFLFYRTGLRLASVMAASGLAIWLWSVRAG